MAPLPYLVPLPRTYCNSSSIVLSHCLEVAYVFSEMVACERYNFGPCHPYVICNFVFKIKSKLENSNVLIVISLHGVQV